MITGELKNKVDRIWEMFWTGGLPNPLDVIEQITYLMFIRDLDLYGFIEKQPDRKDAKGDLYEYMLSKLTTAGTNGQFRTPRHIIRMIVELLDLKPDDIICDPATRLAERADFLCLRASI